LANPNVQPIFSYEKYGLNVRTVCKKYFIAVLIFLRYDMTNTVFPNSVSYQPAVAEHWNLPTTEIFQFKDVASQI
jgi:hypothetical protein